MATPAEISAMRRAIALSAFGLATASPNPPVGCVILDASGRIAGQGYHERKGEAHAETRALAMAGERAAGGAAVVTLEPCNHHGRTPPCRQALIDASVRRVVIALIDPTSRREGGAAALRAAGVDVEVGLLEAEARLVLGTWFSSSAARRPVVTWAYEVTADGIRELPGGTEDARLLRSHADVVLDADGHVTEGVQARHGAGILSLKDAAPGDEPQTVLTALFAGGARSLLLQVGADLARPFLAAGLVDRITAHLYADAGPQPALPDGFTMTGVTKGDGFVRIEASHDGGLG